MKVHMQDDQFDLLVFKGRGLLLFNTFPYKNEDGFLYFVFAVAEELSLSPETFNMVFFGKYARYKKCYEVLEKYHKKIVFSDQTGFLMFDRENILHPILSIFSTDANYFGYHKGRKLITPKNFLFDLRPIAQKRHCSTSFKITTIGKKLLF